MFFKSVISEKMTPWYLTSIDILKKIILVNTMFSTSELNCVFKKLLPVNWNDDYFWSLNADAELYFVGILTRG